MNEEMVENYITKIATNKCSPKPSSKRKRKNKWNECVRFQWIERIGRKEQFDFVAVVEGVTIGATYTFHAHIKRQNAYAYGPSNGLLRVHRTQLEILCKPGAFFFGNFAFLVRFCCSFLLLFFGNRFLSQRTFVVLLFASHSCNGQSFFTKKKTSQKEIIRRTEY